MHSQTQAYGFRNLHKYGVSITHQDIWKTLALLWMIVDHLGYYILPESDVLRALGRWSAPIWFFFAGYATPSKRISAELVYLCLLLVFINLTFNAQHLQLNILATILACRVFIWSIERVFNRPPFIFVLLIIAVWYLPTSLFFEYGSVALLCAYAGYQTRNPTNALHFASSWLCSVCFYLAMQASLFSFSTPLFGLAAMGVVAHAYLLSHFKPFTRGLSKTSSIRALQYIAMYCGRNSHYIYVLHIALFLCWNAAIA